MAYTIRYGTCNNERKKHKFHKKKWFWGFIAVLLLSILSLDAKLRLCLLPGDPAVTAAALDTLQENLRSGQAFGEVFAAFCLEILHGAAVGY